MKYLSFALVSLVIFASAARAQDAVFIAHPSVTDSSLSSDDVKSILLGTKTKWDGGGNIKLAVLTEGAVHEKVIQQYTQRSTDQFDKFWKKQVFTGKGMAPATAKTDADMIDYVAKNPGAFGYVAKESATDKIKVLAIK